MSESQFYTFFTGGLGLLTAAALLIAWQLWRIHDDARDGAASALEGVAHEMRINLQRFVNEIVQVHSNREAGPDVLLPVRHPQLDGVNASLIRANRNGLAVVGSTYQELDARKMALRAALAQRRDPSIALDDAMDATINGIAALYMWEVHKGARPADVGSVRSWHVRDWMKGHVFTQNSLPGMFLRDEVVERLRAYGLHLTPSPLTHTAAEYYSMQYDRKADLSGPLGRRKSPEQLEHEALKAQEKADKKAAREAEKEALKAEKEAEKAALRAEKEAEKAAKAAAASEPDSFDEPESFDEVEEMEPPPEVAEAAPEPEPAPPAAAEAAPSPPPETVFASDDDFELAMNNPDKDKPTDTS